MSSCMRCCVVACRLMMRTFPTCSRRSRVVSTTCQTICHQVGYHGDHHGSTQAHGCVVVHKCGLDRPVACYLLLKGKQWFRLCAVNRWSLEQWYGLLSSAYVTVLSSPAGWCAGARDLIPRMLLVDPLKRITIPEIRQHVWFNMHLPRYLAVMQVRALAHARLPCDSTTGSRPATQSFHRSSALQEFQTDGWVWCACRQTQWSAQYALMRRW